MACVCVQNTGGEGGGTHGDPGLRDATGQGGTFRTHREYCCHAPHQAGRLIPGALIATCKYNDNLIV
jgi:hypothetical protein